MTVKCCLEGVVGLWRYNVGLPTSRWIWITSHVHYILQKFHHVLLHLEIVYIIYLYSPLFLQLLCNKSTSWTQPCYTNRKWCNMCAMKKQLNWHFTVPPPLHLSKVTTKCLLQSWFTINSFLFSSFEELLRFLFALHCGTLPTNCFSFQSAVWLIWSILYFCHLSALALQTPNIFDLVCSMDLAHSVSLHPL